MSISLGKQLASIVIYDTVYAIYYDNGKIPRIVLVHRHYLDPKWNSEFEFVDEQKFEDAVNSGLATEAEYAKHWLESLKKLHIDTTNRILQIISDRNTAIANMINGI